MAVKWHMKHFYQRALGKKNKIADKFLYKLIFLSSSASQKQIIQFFFMMQMFGSSVLCPYMHLSRYLNISHDKQYAMSWDNPFHYWSAVTVGFCFYLDKVCLLLTSIYWFNFTSFSLNDQVELFIYIVVL